MRGQDTHLVDARMAELLELLRARLEAGPLSEDEAMEFARNAYAVGYGDALRGDLS